MKRYLIGLAIGIVIMILSLAIVIYFGKYEQVSFMIISAMSGFIGMQLSYDLFPKKKDFWDSSIEDYNKGYDLGFEDGYQEAVEDLELQKN